MSTKRKYFYKLYKTKKKKKKKILVLYSSNWESFLLLSFVLYPLNHMFCGQMLSIISEEIFIQHLMDSKVKQMKLCQRQNLTTIVQQNHVGQPQFKRSHDEVWRYVIYHLQACIPFNLPYFLFINLRCILKSQERTCRVLLTEP